MFLMIGTISINLALYRYSLLSLPGLPNMDLLYPIKYIISPPFFLNVKWLYDHRRWEEDSGVKILLDKNLHRVPFLYFLGMGVVSGNHGVIFLADQVCTRSLLLTNWFNTYKNTWFHLVIQPAWSESNTFRS